MSEPPEDDDDASEVRDLDDDTDQLIDEERELAHLEMEKKRLQIAVATEQARRDIAALQAVLAKGPSEHLSVPPSEPNPRLTGTPLVDDSGDEEVPAPRLGSKRPRSPELEQRTMVKHMAHPKAPSAYHGKNLKEHRDFVYECSLTFRLAPHVYHSDAKKVLYGMQHLHGDARERWKNHEKIVGADCSSWDEFTDFLLDIIQDPVNRGISTMQRYSEAVQKPGQSIHNFVTYLESLEADLPVYTEEHRLNHLFTKLRPEIRERITNFQHIPQTMDGMVSLAARIEENMRPKHRTIAPRRGGDEETERKSRASTPDPPKEKGRRSRGDHRGRGRGGRGASSAHRGPTEPNTLPVTANRGGRDLSDVECYTCHKKGHIAPHCPDKVITSSKNGQAPR